MADIVNSWDRKNKPSTFRRITSSMKKSPPLRERISYTIYRMKVQRNKLDQAYTRMQNHYNKLFKKCTDAILNKDTTRASIYANECAEIRKMSQTILTSQFAIEQVTLRLETVEEFGDVVVEMSPVAGVISSIKGHLAGVLPEVSYKLGEIGDSLNNLVMDSGGATSWGLSVSSSGSEAERILADANAIAEQKMKERFPTLPATGLPSLEKSVEVDFTE